MDIGKFCFMHSILSCESVLQFKRHPSAGRGSKSFSWGDSCGKGCYYFIFLSNYTGKWFILRYRFICLVLIFARYSEIILIFFFILSLCYLFFVRWCLQTQNMHLQKQQFWTHCIWCIMESTYIFLWWTKVSFALIAYVLPNVIVLSIIYFSLADGIVTACLDVLQITHAAISLVNFMFESQNTW